MVGKRSIGLLMSQVVRHMNEERALGLEPLDELQRILEAGMRGMRAPTQRVKKKNVESGEIGNRLLGDTAEVGCVACVAEAVGGDGMLAVQNLQRAERRAEELKRTVEAVHLYAR